MSPRYDAFIGCDVRSPSRATLPPLKASLALGAAEDEPWCELCGETFERAADEHCEDCHVTYKKSRKKGAYIKGG